MPMPIGDGNQSPDHEKVPFLGFYIRRQNAILVRSTVAVLILTAFAVLQFLPLTHPLIEVICDAERRSHQHTRTY